MKEDKEKYYSEKDLERFFAGELSSDAEELVRDWIADPQDEEEKEKILKRFFDKQVNPTTEPGEKAHEMLENFRERVRKNKKEAVVLGRSPKKFWTGTRKIAAVLLPLIVLSVAGLMYFNNIDKQKEETVPRVATIIEATDRNTEAVLPDGSVITLNKNAVISYYEETFLQEREVELSGEAYFKVAKKDGAPFTVTTEALKINVLGTIFNVNASKGSAETVVSLYQGAVAVETEGNTNVLAPHEEFSWNNETKSSDMRKISSSIPAWMISGHAISLGDIFKLIEDQYEVKVAAAPTVNTEQLYYFIFNEKAGIEETLSLLCEINGNMKYDIKNDTVYIKSLR